MKLTLASHWRSLENKGLAREVSCLKQFHTTQSSMWKGDLESIPRIWAKREPADMVASGLYVVRSDAGDTGPRPDQDHTAGILPDEYLLCSKAAEDSLLQRQRLRWRRVVVPQSATTGRRRTADAPWAAPRSAGCKSHLCQTPWLRTYLFSCIDVAKNPHQTKPKIPPILV